jgi:PAS domain S-box-containing protein
MKVTHKIIASLAGAALLVALGVEVSFWTFSQMKEASEARKHTFILLNDADDLLAALIDAETGQRGFLLAGDEVFLEPYLAVRDSISGDLQKLRQHTQISAAHQHLDALAPLIDAKLAYFSHNIELRRNNDMTAALAYVRGSQGKPLMDSIRAEMHSFDQIEQDALAQHDAEFQANLRLLFILIVSASLFTLLFALTFVWLIYRDRQQRLKNLVHLETQHLLELQEETNARLQQVNATLQVSEEKLAITLNSIGDAVIATDAEACVILMNPLAEQLTGWTQAEASGRPVNEIFHIINKETRHLATIPVFDALEHGTIQGLANHTVLIARDGRESDIADSCSPIRDRDGHVVGAVLVFRDVTGEYAAQQALRDSAAQIQAILNTVADGIITLHASGGIVATANPAAERMFGYTAAELIGKNLSLLIPELERDQRNGNGSLDHYSASDEERASGLGREVVGRRKDGSAFPIEIAVSEMQLNGQRYFTGLLRDITARKQAKEALRASEELFKTMFVQAPLGIAVIDSLTGHIYEANPRFAEISGRSMEELPNTDWMQITHPDDVQADLDNMALVNTGKTNGFQMEKRYLHPDGTTVWINMTIGSLNVEDKAHPRHLCMIQDNTARKQIEAEQKQLDQRLRDQQFYTRSLIESSIDALMTTNPSGIISDVNKQMEALTGCTRDELIGAPFKNYFTDPKQAEAGIKLVLSEKKVTDYELTARARDGKETVVSYNATTFYDRERTLQGVFAAARDVTERKRLDRELESAKFVAEQASLAKSDFLSSMSHELRTPLNAILGFAQLMESDSPAPTLAQRGSITQILQAGWHLLTLINEILDLEKIESGQASLSREPVSLAEVMRECQGMIEPQAQQRDIRMSFHPFDNSWFANADRTRVKQVLINLLSNAIKYNREHGTVEVDCTASTPERLRISIKDSGVGLNPEQLAQLFQPFNRLGQEAGGEEGTGIGLVVAKRLVELMGGVIGVESTVGEGSVFWFELRAVAEPQLSKLSMIAMERGVVATLAQAHVPHGTWRQTLLYVEDNPANLKLVEQIIARHPNISLLTAVDGNSGIEIARASLPDVILMDINLPGINGFEALKILRADPATAHIPVIAISANAMPRDIKKGVELGFLRYITKPIKVDEFMEALEVALEFAQQKVGQSK